VSRSVQVKVCGVTDAAFAAEAEAMGVDFLGFIFASGSPRRVAPETVRGILSGLAGRAVPVGVFRGQPMEEVLALAREAGVAVVQLHGGYAPRDVRAAKAAGFAVWMLDEGTPPVPEADGVLVDGRDGARVGGTGKTADWPRARALAASGVFTVLAGGLGERNAREAAATGCAVLDFNSALETAPGKKSRDLLAKTLGRLE